VQLITPRLGVFVTAITLIAVDQLNIVLAWLLCNNKTSYNRRHRAGYGERRYSTLSVCHMHSRTLLKRLDGMGCHLIGTHLWPLVCADLHGGPGQSEKEKICRPELSSRPSGGQISARTAEMPTPLVPVFTAKLRFNVKS